MFTTMLLVLTSLFSTLDPLSVDWSAAAERMHMQEPAPVASVQLELLPDAEGAAQLAASVQHQLDAAGFELVVGVETVSGELELPPSYRVGVGPFSSFEDAERARTHLEDLGLDGFIRAAVDEVAGC